MNTAFIWSTQQIDVLQQLKNPKQTGNACVIGFYVYCVLFCLNCLILGHHHAQKGAAASHSSVRGPSHHFKLVVKYIKNA